MRRLLLIQLITICFLSCSSAFAYIYHCPATISEYYRSGDQEIWPEIIQSDPTAMGMYHLVGAQYDKITGEGLCVYQCDGCNSQGYCPCNKPGNITVKGTVVEPIINDNTQWRPSLHGSTIICAVLNNCPWKLKDSSSR